MADRSLMLPSLALDLSLDPAVVADQALAWVQDELGRPFNEVERSMAKAVAMKAVMLTMDELRSLSKEMDENRRSSASLLAIQARAILEPASKEDP